MSSGNEFMRLREKLGLTQRQVAEAIGVTDQTVSNWERGVYAPKLTPRQTAKLCQTLSLTVQELADLLEPEKQPES
ncbi:helix-turn-helix transcriptional regulator [Leptolyngbya sp. AN02str]|uniref:helix-turn-helix transcriptional regulator n=1 Tax=Leptolyngbya sp. AN02str TaxID=3423363 RepID=UPI003D320B54